jgi:hypothetical protein
VGSYAQAPAAEDRCRGGRGAPLALELLALGAPINSLVLKQYRAGDDVGKACYQALVRTQRSIQRIYDLREIDERVHVRLHRYPGHPIAQTLGLQVKSVDSAGGEVVQNAAAAPF